MEILMAIFESAVYGTRVELPQKNREHPLPRWRAEAAPFLKSGEVKDMPRDYGTWLSLEDERLYKIVLSSQYAHFVRFQFSVTRGFY